MESKDSGNVLIVADGEVLPPDGVYRISGMDPPVFPDYEVWKQTSYDDHLMKLYLAKGYCAPREVTAEYQPGKTFINTLFTSEANVQLAKTNKLDKLNDILSNAQLKRRDFNKAKPKLLYKPPSRMTLTEHKKDIWLNKLSDPKIPLNQLSKAIPHGLRNKALLEQCLLHKVPLSRSIWLIRCVASNEQRQLHRKLGANATITTNKWVIEWTEQVTSFLESIIAGCFYVKNEKTSNWVSTLDFTTELVVNLYIEGLMDKVTFLAWIVRYLSSAAKGNQFNIQSLKYLSIHYLFLKKFWFKIIKVDYLAKELGEALLLITLSMNELSKNPKYDQLVSNMLAKFQYLIRFLFYYNSDAYIIPSYWNKLKTHLKKLLDIHIPAVNDQYNLILYRNESLMIADAENSMSYANGVSNKSSNLYFNSIDQTSLIIAKLNNFRDESLDDLLKLIFDETVKNNISWKDHTVVILKWAIQNNIFPETDNDYSLQRITLVISLLRKRSDQLTKAKTKKSKQLKLDLEVIITEFVNNISEVLNFHNTPTAQGKSYSLSGFLVLLSKLNEHKMFIISSYLRKLIASGVIYLSKADRTCYIHLLILNNITELRVGNSKNILKRLSESTGIFPPEQDTQADNLKSSILIFWDIMSLDVEVPGDATKAFEDFKSNWTWKLDCENSILYSNLKQKMADNVIGLLKHGKLDNIDTGVSRIALSLTRLAIFIDLGIELDIIEDVLELIIIGINRGLYSGDGKQSLIFETRSNDLIPHIMMLVTYYEKLLKSSLNYINAEETKWEAIIKVFQRWSNTDELNICEWYTLLESSSESDRLFDNSKAELDASSMEILTLIIGSEELNTLGFSSYERIMNVAEFNQHFNNALALYLNFIKGLDNSQNYIPVIKFLNFLRRWKPEEFEIHLVGYITRNFSPSLILDYDINRKIFTRMISDGLLTISKFIEMVEFITSQNITQTTNNGSFLHNSYDKLLSDILFNIYDDQVVLDDLERFRLKFYCWKYSIEYPEKYFKFVYDAVYAKFKKSNLEIVNSESLLDVNIIGESNVGVNTPMETMPAMPTRVSVSEGVNVSVGEFDTFPELSDVPMVQRSTTSTKTIGSCNRSASLSKYIIGGFWALMNHHMDLFVKFFYQNESQQFSSKSLIAYFLNGNAVESDLPWQEEVEMIVNSLSYFNLPLYQWIFRCLLMDSVVKENANEISNICVNLLENLMRTIRTMKNSKMNSGSIVGELFSYLPDNIKTTLLLACEEVYLTSDTFPSFSIEGENMTDYLNSIISSCSRFKYEEQNAELTDALVFSLNMSIEKLIYYCHGLDHPKKRNHGNRHIKLEALNKGTKMISKIIMLHKTFLVNLIIKRSINLQKDVLLMNLTKLYNNKTIARNPKLKNLLYDVLISLKILITESIIQEQQRQFFSQGVQQAQQVVPNTHALWLNKGTPSSFLSPHSSPKVGGQLLPSNATGSTIYVNIPSILNIKPPSLNNNLKYLLKYFDIEDTIEELERKLFIINQRADRSLDGDAIITRYTYKPFDMIADINSNGITMDAPVSLGLFECSFDKKNPK